MPKDLHNIDYEDFKKFAYDKTLSKYEKIGFPDKYRKGKEELILKDIISKVPILESNSLDVFDVGCGCSDLPHLIYGLCKKKGHRLTLNDSQEMLDLVNINTKKIPGEFPSVNLEGMHSDVIIVYSVIQYVHKKGQVDSFLSAAIDILRPGGYILIGDIPNREKRKRFFESSEGVEFHKKFTGKNDKPEIEPLKPDDITDAFAKSIKVNLESKGLKVDILAQPNELPMGNHREDVLIYKPSP